MSNQHTTDEIFAPIGPPTPEEQPTRFIDIHIYEQEPEPEEPPSVESEQKHTELVRPNRKGRTIIALCVSLVSFSMIGIFAIVYALPLLISDATITIVPITQQVRATTRIIVTIGQATGTQLQGRALAALTMTQAQTVATTGRGHQDARAAHGYLTFYNAATYPQVVAAGTLLTGNDGTQVITNQNVSVPAAIYPTFGQATVAAQAVITGPRGNIQAGDIYGLCCRLNVSAVNSPFTGGQEARNYQTVTAQDISAVASNLKTSLNQSAQAALQTQVHRDETLITPLPCQQSVKPDHQPGEEATQVQITVSETCTGMTYSTQAYQTRIMQLTNQQATHQLGDGYVLVGQVQSTVTQTVPKEHNQTELHVTVAGAYALQISSQQQQDIKTLIAGKSKAQAMNAVLHTPGIQSVSINGATLPTDTKHIRVIVVYVGSNSPNTIQLPTKTSL